MTGSLSRLPRWTILLAAVAFMLAASSFAAPAVAAGLLPSQTAVRLWYITAPNALGKGSATAISVDRTGAAYVATCGFLQKISPSGTSILWKAAVPGEVTAMAFGRGDNIFVTGQTSLPDFPTVHALQPSLDTSTGVGITGLAVDGAGNACVAGPALGPETGAVIMLGPEGQIRSVALAGVPVEIFDLALSSSGNVFLAGRHTNWPKARRSVCPGSGGLYNRLKWLYHEMRVRP